MRWARLFGALVLLGACSDSSGPGQGPGRAPSPAIISSVVQPAAASDAALLGGQAYVSMVPWTDANGRRVDIRNLQSGATATSTMTNGGFDPIAIQAEAGDTLSIRVVHDGGGDTTAYGEVPIDAKPTIVRTSPWIGQTAVPLHNVIRVVFNQPMDGASLPDALRLRQGGIDVPGSASSESTGGVILSGRFAPASPLVPLSTYQLSVSTAAQSPDGDPLGTPLTAEFTTGSWTGVARLRVVHAETGVGDMDVLIDEIKVATDLRYATATDYLEMAAGYHEVRYQVGSRTIDETRAVFDPGIDYSVLPCCELFAGFGILLEDDNTEPAPGNVRLRVVNASTVDDPVHVYLTSPEASLSPEGLIATVGWSGATGYVEVPAGEYRIRITSSDYVVRMDSGTLTLGPGQVRTVVAVDWPEGGAPRRFAILEDLN